jgi:hypothetical protein
MQFLGGYALKHFQVGVAGALGVGNRGDIFAEMVKADHHACVIARAGGGIGFIQRLAGHETARHGAGHAIGSDPTGEFLAFGELEKCGTEHARSIMAASAERN